MRKKSMKESGKQQGGERRQCSTYIRIVVGRVVCFLLFSRRVADPVDVSFPTLPDWPHGYSSRCYAKGAEAPDSKFFKKSIRWAPRFCADKITNKQTKLFIYVQCSEILVQKCIISSVVCYLRYLQFSTQQIHLVELSIFRFFLLDKFQLKKTKKGENKKIEINIVVV